MIEQPYEHIWDCCCDHGYLGLSLLNSTLGSKIHFVDIVSNLIDRIERNLQSSKFETDRWQTHCVDLRQLKLPESNSRHLVVIAGVGGDLTIEFVNKIVANNPDHYIDFIVCPVRHNYLVRKALKAQGYQLSNEALVCENKLFYEVIHVSKTAVLEIVETGSLMWDLDSAKHIEYLIKTIEHYERACQSKPDRYNTIATAYNDLIKHI